MAHPYDDRQRSEYRGERGGDRGNRNFMERAGEEVRSWFGGDDRDRHPREEYDRGRDRMGSERGWSSGERTEGGRRSQAESERWRNDEERWRREPGEYGRADYARWGSGLRGWDDSRYGRGTVESGRREPDASAREARGDDWRWRSSNESRGTYEDDQGRVHSFAHWPETNYAGRGPKGYRRSDERIREDICDRLTDDWGIDASEMEVTVQNGEVTLAGTVRNREDKRRTEDLVENVTGVRDVHNNLRVGRFDEGATSRATGASAPGTATTTPPSARR